MVLRINIKSIKKFDSFMKNFQNFHINLIKINNFFELRFIIFSIYIPTIFMKTCSIKNFENTIIKLI